MMFTTTTTILATLMGISPFFASAAPVASEGGKINDNDVFRILTIRSGSDIQYGAFQAAQRSLYINTPHQNATCNCPDVNYASFYLSNGALFLATPSGSSSQQFFVDRSGMGQGVIQYNAGGSPIGRNQERGPFGIDANGNLVFGANKDTGFQACPGAAPGGYSVWLQGQQNPGFNKDCVPFVAKAIKEEKPVLCIYTQ